MTRSLCFSWLVSLRTVAVILSLSMGVPPVLAQSVDRHHFDIPSQDLGKALTLLGQQAEREIVFSAEVTRGKHSAAVKGDLTAKEALEKMLAGSGLTYRVPDSGPVVVAAAPGSKVETGPRQNEEVPTSVKSDSVSLEQIVVTGTYIRDHEPVGAHVITITREDIQNAGFATPQELFESLPENFHGVNSVGSYSPQSSVYNGPAGQNHQGASAIDLFGLGAQSTLVLLNGKRVASALDGQAVDISTFPFSVIERVDIGSGGRSAIYGSDAVAGVVNFITRRDFEGAEAQASYGGSDTGGGGGRLQLSQVVGAKWGRGGFVAALDYTKADMFDLVKAGLTTRVPGNDEPVLLAAQPRKETRTGYLSGHYQANDAIDVYGDALYTNASTLSIANFVYTTDTYYSPFSSQSTQYNISGGALFSLPASWRLDISGNYSVQHSEVYTPTILDGATDTSDKLFRDNTSVATASAVADGFLLSIGGHQLSAALGGDFRHEIHAGRYPGDSGGRTVGAVFAEAALPLVTDGAHVGLRRLEVSGAERYDHYSDFGKTTNGQLGLVWSPLVGVAVRASYATAFRAPSLSQSHEEPFASVFPQTDPQSAAGTSPLLTWSGGNPALGPETSRTWTSGLEFKPVFARWAKLSLDYLDINYTHRIDEATSGFPNGNYLYPQVESLLSNFINRNPTAAELSDIEAATAISGGVKNYTKLPYNSATQTLLQAFPNLIVLDRRLQNIAQETYRGLTLDAQTRFETKIGRLSFGANGSHTINHRRRFHATTPNFSLLNDVGKPVPTQVRGSAGWEWGPLGAFAFVNYVEGYPNSFATPPARMPSWTTVDLTLRFDGSSLAQKGWFHGFQAALSAQNLLDRSPPRLAQDFFGILYDSANANPFGRVVSLRLTEKW